MGAIVAQSIMLFTIIKLLGAAYLIYLGMQAIRHRKDGVADNTESARPSLTPAVMLRQGFIVGVTNPKTIVFFVAVLPQFVTFGAGAIPLQMMILGLLFVAIGFICDAVWGDPRWKRAGLVREVSPPTQRDSRDRRRIDDRAPR
ncbi:LysE family translocator [Microbacterium sp.]|uniref:LysE family translocator n=1 Tax=Microbacterium sp. TaxID=51671 RepID=UPI003A8BB116